MRIRAYQLRDNKGQRAGSLRPGKTPGIYTCPKGEARLLASDLSTALNGGNWGEQAYISYEQQGKQLEILSWRERRWLRLANKIEKINSKFKTIDFAAYDLRYESAGRFYQRDLNTEKGLEGEHYDFLNQQARRLLDMCRERLGCPPWSSYRAATTFAEELNSLQERAQEIQKQEQKLEREEHQGPILDQGLFQQLQAELEVLKSMAEDYQYLISSQRNLTAKQNERKQVNAALAKGLAFCQLEQLPKSGELPDWSTPLQCLCYLQVIDKIIPVLEQSLKQLHKHYALNSGREERERLLVKALSKVLPQLQSHLLRLQSAQKNGESKTSWWRKKTPANEQGNWESIQPYLKQLEQLLHSLSAAQQQQAVQPVDLQDFLRQCQTKGERLQKHWEVISKELGLQVGIDLHNFSQYILRYNELILLGQRQQQLQTEFEEREHRVARLRSTFQSWQTLTKSQKEVQVSQVDVLLNEVQNILRYREEKEQRLNSLQSQRDRTAGIDLLRQQAKAATEELEREWQDFRETYDLKPKQLDEVRMQEVGKYFKILASMEHFGSALPSVKPQTAFGGDYPEFCVWQLSGLPLGISELSLLLDNLQDCAPDSQHLICGYRGDVASLGLGSFLPLNSSEQQAIAGFIQRLNQSQTKAKTQSQEKVQELLTVFRKPASGLGPEKMPIT